ncbi:MAG TPA: HAD family hydrolase [Campylobacterales bacterium]|nr:HAD family hydrolase [Campylobacterales bacterium]
MKVIIFDMDGTLIDSSVDITDTINQIRDKHHNLPPVKPEYIVEAINRPVRNLPELFYHTETYHDQDKQLFEELYYDNCIKNVTLYRGVTDTLEKLKSKQIHLSVATNAYAPFAKRMLEHLNIGDYFDHIVGADTLGISKPDPSMLHHILKHYGFDYDAHDAWMVGDNTKDILAGQNATINTVQSTWGFEAIQANADWRIHHPEELLGIVESR